MGADAVTDACRRVLAGDAETAELALEDISKHLVEVEHTKGILKGMLRVFNGESSNSVVISN